MTITALPGTDVIDVTQLEALRAADPSIRILDVRTGGEFEIAHIPGSYNVPLDTLAEHVHDLASLEHPVVLICQSGGRATKAHEHLTTAGKERLHILEGGMNAWLAAGRDVVRGDTSHWAMDRQVRLVAGSIALAGIAASVAVPKAKWLAAGVAGLRAIAEQDWAVARVRGLHQRRHLPSMQRIHPRVLVTREKQRRRIGSARHDAVVRRVRLQVRKLLGVGRRAVLVDPPRRDQESIVPQHVEQRMPADYSPE